MKTIYFFNLILILLIINTSIYSQSFVLIDAGHGGTDAGAVGSCINGKEINLEEAIAVWREIGVDLDNHWYTLLTRNDDYAVSLQDKYAMANNPDNNWVDATGDYIPAGGVDFFLSMFL